MIRALERRLILLAALLLLALLAACGRPPAGLPAAAQPAAGAQATAPAAPSATPSPRAQATATAQATPAPTHTPTVAATATASSTPSSTPTASSTPTITPTPLHPLSIDAMRARDYPGSDLTVEETLEAGANYDRFIVSYRSDGLKIYALMTLPHGPTPPNGWPVIIFNHGYIPPAIYRTTERYEPHIDNLARHQYIILRPDYRGHGESEGRPGGAYGSPDYTVDVLNALASIRRHPQADAQRIGMWGHSMGGQITLRAMVVDPGIRGGVIWAGVVGSYPDLLRHWRRDGGFTPTPDPTTGPRGWRQRFIADYGGPNENPEFWASISPNSYVHELSGPVQLHHGDADEEVPVILSELLEGEIQAVGGYVDLWVYEGDDHNITGWFNFAMERTLIFFARFVKG